MVFEDTREDLDFTSEKDMSLSFLSEVREKILDAIENHLDEHEPEDWGFQVKSNCYSVIQDLFADEGVHDNYYEKLMAEAEANFNTEVLFRNGILASVSTTN